MSKFKESIVNIDCLVRDLTDVEGPIRELADLDTDNFSDEVKHIVSEVVTQWDYIVSDHLVKADA